MFRGRQPCRTHIDCLNLNKPDSDHSVSAASVEQHDLNSDPSDLKMFCGWSLRGKTAGGRDTDSLENISRPPCDLGYVHDRQHKVLWSFCSCVTPSIHITWTQSFQVRYRPSPDVVLNLMQIGNATSVSKAMWSVSKFNATARTLKTTFLLIAQRWRDWQDTQAEMQQRYLVTKVRCW